MKKAFIIFLSIVVLAAVSAHEYILMAAAFKLSKGDTLELHLFVADGFNVQLERPLQTGITKRFELLTENGQVNLLSGSANGTLPILNRVVDFEGSGLLQLERDYSAIALPTKKFLSYLEEDHIDNIKKAVVRKQSVQREIYTRYLKCLVQSGHVKTDTLYKTVTGQHLEIILLQHPYALHPGSTIKARILFEGRPLAHKTITARNRTGNAPAAAFTATTNIKGECSFLLNRKGDWFIHATHMIPSTDTALADWESFWASYSFAVE